MSDFRIIYTRPEDGGVSVIVPANETTVDEAAQSVPTGVPYEIVDASAIPADREFRNAWERNGKAIVHSMTKAKAIAHERRRVARAAEFAPLDVEATIPAKANQAEAARQAIRDKYATIQANIDSARDISALKSVLGAM